MSKEKLESAGLGVMRTTLFIYLFLFYVFLHEPTSYVLLPAVLGQLAWG